MLAPEDLVHIPFFRELPAHALEQVTARMRIRDFTADEPVAFRGDPADALYLVLSGALRVSLTNAEGIPYTIDTLAAGGLFGETALLTGEPISANITALSQVRLARLSQEDFRHLTTDFPELYGALCQVLARRLGQNIAQSLRTEEESRELIATLVGTQPRPDIDELPGQSRATCRLNREIERLAASTEHVLISGEPGTGKDLVARLVHFRRRSPGPLFHLDCRNPPPVLRETETGGKDGAAGLHLDISQFAALFGHAPESAVYARGARRGYLELADGGDLILENVDALTPDVQQLLAAYCATGAFSRKGESTRRYSRVRLIASSEEDLAALAAAGRFDTSLRAVLCAESLRLRPLRELKRDIPAIAQHYLGPLGRKHNKQVRCLNQAAVNILVDYDWPFNITELKQVLERAVALCPGEEVQAEHIFLNVASFSGRGRFNLLTLPRLRTLVDSVWFPGVLKAAAVPGLLAAILLCLFGPAAQNPVNLAVWILWWPGLILSVALGARFWCGWCPLAAAAEWLHPLRRALLPVPGWLRSHGYWIATLGFVAILVAEQLTDMFEQARPTGVLLASLLGGALLTTWLFGERVWCRYLCPLGRLVGQGARLSLVELLSNANVCTSQCEMHDCIKEKSCPMGLHPTAANTTDDCVLCFTCVRNCPHRSVRLDLRVPWSGLLGSRRRETGGALFAVLLLGTVLAVVLMPLLLQRAPGPDLVSLLGFSAFIGGFALLGSAACLSKGGIRRNLSLAGYAHLPLALAGLFNLYFEEMIGKGPQLLPLAADSLGIGPWLERAWITPELGTLAALVPLITLTGWGFSYFLLDRMVEADGLPHPVCRAQKLLLFGAAALLLFLF